MMKTMRSNVFSVVSAVVVAAFCVGCVSAQFAEPSVPGPVIHASLGDDVETRTVINSGELTDDSEKAIVLWTPGDQLGVFTDGGSSNVLYVNSEKELNLPKSSFSTSASLTGNITYAYYPYSAENNGKAADQLSGTVPAQQAMGQDIPGDYKYAYKKEETEEGYRFKFKNLFSLVHFKIDAGGTALADKTLESIVLTVTRDGSAVPVTGSFTFSAADGVYEPIDGKTSNTLTTVWNEALDGPLSSFASVFPNIKAGDKLNFVFKAGIYEATLNVKAGTDFEAGKYYTFPLTLSMFGGLKITKRVSGSFKAATYNVDGLPKKISLITINGDGPGADGTKNISAKIAQQDWDFIGFSEDFEYNDELKSSLGSYAFGTHRGSVSASALVSTLDTDGLEFATRNSTCRFISEDWTEFTSAHGGLSGGANTCIEKGFRHYVVEMNDGAQFDVLITHMNTYSSSSSKYMDAQHKQLTQIAQYINSILGNGRPIIFMGDTNCRYTRHDFKTYFWDKLNSDLAAIDPWVTYQWAGVYPTYPSKSLMVSDATGTDSSTDIICADTQKGEVVDKIIYINNPNSGLTITANSYLRDYQNFNGLADHMPIVAGFDYEGTVTVN